MKVAGENACISQGGRRTSLTRRQPALTFPSGNMANRKQLAAKRPISSVTSDDGVRPAKSIQKISFPSYEPFIDPSYATSSRPATFSANPPPDTLGTILDTIPEAQPVESSGEDELPLSRLDPLYGMFSTPTPTTNAAARATESEARGLAAAETLETLGLDRLFTGMSSTLLTNIMGLPDGLVLALLDRQSPESVDNVVRELARITYCATSIMR
jgi:hypothetical protein